MRPDAVDENRSSLAVGVKVNGLRLAPGESLMLPSVHLGFFTGGATSATNVLRRYLYEHVCARYHGELMIPRVTYGTWFGFEARTDLEGLKTQARRAAEIGIEVFAIDASWFPGGFPDGVGNWDRIDPDRFPDNMEELAPYVRGLGMEMGSWFECERAIEGTWAVETHPEWFVPVPKPDHSAKQAYHLNLAERGAQDWVIETVGGWIERLGLGWICWDYNIEPQPFWEAFDPTLKIQFTYMEGLNRVLDTLMAMYPNLLVQGCASGGRRIDIGTMRRAHTYWISDQAMDPLLCRYMQARANRFLPGHLLDRRVPVPANAGDEGYDDAAVLSRMLGKLAFDGDIASWSPRLSARMARWVAEFKAIRHLLVQDFYQLLPLPTTAEDWDAIMFVDYAGADAVLFAFADQVRGGEMTLRLQGLRAATGYRLVRRLEGPVLEASGDELMAKGIQLRLQPNESGLWRISAL
jgi:alpha-galactosidase